MKYPEYDRSKYTVWALPHPLILHWILNPGLAFNELILGQRLPKVSLIDKTSDKPLLERSYTPCPHCLTLHDARRWGKGNALGHWFGLVCPTCEKIIPCLWNLTSLLLLALTLPLWFLPARLLRPRWLAWEKKRLANQTEEPLIEAKNINWLSRGTFFFGGLMWVLMSLAPQVFLRLNGKPANWHSVWIMLPLWLLGGLIFGAVTGFWMNKKGRESEKNPSDPYPLREQV